MTLGEPLSYRRAMAQAKKKRGPGRPPLGKRARTARFEIRLTGDDLDRYQAAAAREGLTLSAWWQAAAELALARGSTR